MKQKGHTPEQIIHKVQEAGERFWMIRAGKDACSVFDTVTGEQSVIVESAVGQLNRYLTGNYCVGLSSVRGPLDIAKGAGIVLVAGDVPITLREAGFVAAGVGDQGFVVKQMEAPCGGRWLIVWGETPLGCRYGLMEVIRSLQGTGGECFTEIGRTVDAPRFPMRVYYHNFGEHLVNCFSVNMLRSDVAFARWSHDDWRRYLEMIAAMRYTTFEFWLSPTFFSTEALKNASGSKYETYAQTMRWVIGQAHELGLQVETLISVNCTESNWVSLCPSVPAQHSTLLALWDHWTKRLSNADVFGIFPGDVGGCYRNGCTPETYINLCLEIIGNTKQNGSFSFDVNAWGPPFFDWGVPVGQATPERLPSAFAYLLERLPDFPEGTRFSVNMNSELALVFSGPPVNPVWSNRVYVDQLRRTAPVTTWDYYLSESEAAVGPVYRVPNVLSTRQVEAQWGYAGGINYTMTPSLNILTAFAAAEAYWDPDQTANDILARFSSYVFGESGLAQQVFPLIDASRAPSIQVLLQGAVKAGQTLSSAHPLSVAKLFVAPDTESYRQSLLYFADLYEHLSRAAIQVQELKALTGRSNLVGVNKWLQTAPDDESKRVRALLAEVASEDPVNRMKAYESRVYGFYELVSGPDTHGAACDQLLHHFVGDFFGQ